MIWSWGLTYLVFWVWVHATIWSYVFILTQQSSNLWHYFSISQTSGAESQARTEHMEQIKAELENLTHQISTLGQQTDQYQHACVRLKEKKEKIRWSVLEMFNESKLMTLVCLWMVLNLTNTQPTIQSPALCREAQRKSVQHIHISICANNRAVVQSTKKDLNHLTVEHWA